MTFHFFSLRFRYFSPCLLTLIVFILKHPRFSSLKSSSISNLTHEYKSLRSAQKRDPLSNSFLMIFFFVFASMIVCLRKWTKNRKRSKKSFRGPSTIDSWIHHCYLHFVFFVFFVMLIFEEEKSISISVSLKN